MSVDIETMFTPKSIPIFYMSDNNIFTAHDFLKKAACMWPGMK